MYLKQQKTVNIQKTWAIMTVFLLVVIGLGWLIGGYMHNPSAVYFAAGFAIVMNIGAFLFSDKVVLKMARAKEVTYEQYPKLYTIVRNLSGSAKLPVPKLYIIEDSAPNAFATGRSPSRSAVAVTTGLLSLLDENELSGVIAHELSHIRNRDMLVMTIAVILVGFLFMLADMLWYTSLFGGNDSDDDRGGVVGTVIGVGVMMLAPLAGTLMQLAISRKREFLADASGAELTHNPEGLASALEKISGIGLQMKNANHATAHLFIANPFGEVVKRNRSGKLSMDFGKFFATHPPVEERVSMLRHRRM